MTAFLDTAFVIRVLTNDPPHQAVRAIRVLEETPDLRVTNVALAEAAFVLRSRYNVPRAAIVDSLIEFITHEHVDTHPLDRDSIITALELCRTSGRVSFADALIWSEARSAGAATIYTFDRRFPTAGVEVIEPT